LKGEGARLEIGLVIGEEEIGGNFEEAVVEVGRGRGGWGGKGDRKTRCWREDCCTVVGVMGRRAGRGTEMGMLGYGVREEHVRVNLETQLVGNCQE